MKPFSASPKCEKCGGTDIVRAYHQHKHGYGCLCAVHYGLASEHLKDLPPLEVDHHKMYCRGCGFAWQEGVIEECLK